MFGQRVVEPSFVAMAIATYLRTLIADRSKFDEFLVERAGLTPLELEGRRVAERSFCISCHRDLLPFAGPGLNGFGRTGVSPIEHDHGRGAVTRLQNDPGVVVAGVRLHLARTAAFTLAGVVPAHATEHGRGHASLSFAVPDDASLRGLALHGQWLVTDDEAAAGLASSPGFSFTMF